MLLYKVFFVGLLLQFLAFNITTFSWWIDSSQTTFIRLRKEAVIGILWLISLFLIIYNKSRKQLIFPHHILSLQTLLMLWVIAAAYVSIIHHEQTLGAFLLAFKYDFLGFFILFVWFHSSNFLEKQQKEELFQRYGNLIKIILILALWRYAITFIKPWILKLFWYNNLIFEGTAWGQAPAVYYTHINQGLPRSQFLFERPTTRWFFLTALRPLFYFLFLHKKPLATTRWRRVIYGINVMLTFSRAARWTRFIEIILIGILTKEKKIKFKNFFLKTILPIIVIIIGLWAFFFNDIFWRQYSNTGHINEIKKWITLSVEEPIRWHGAWSAWPASHRNPEVPWFNPENQFLQIFIEFWIIWFLPWIALFAYLSLIWIRSVFKEKEHNQFNHIIFALSIWLIGLGISGMVLHSLADRMVVYPFMLLFWIWLNYYLTRNSSVENKSSLPT